MNKTKRIANTIAIIIIIGIVAYGLFTVANGVSVMMDDASSSMISEYDSRVEQKMWVTTEEWNQKHRVWAEQEISKEIIKEQETKLQLLRERELSL